MNHHNNTKKNQKHKNMNYPVSKNLQNFGKIN